MTPRAGRGQRVWGRHSEQANDDGSAGDRWPVDRCSPRIPHRISGLAMGDPWVGLMRILRIPLAMSGCCEWCARCVCCVSTDH